MTLTSSFYVSKLFPLFCMIHSQKNKSQRKWATIGFYNSNKQSCISSLIIICYRCFQNGKKPQKFQSILGRYGTTPASLGNIRLTWKNAAIQSFLSCCNFFSRQSNIGKRGKCHTTSTKNQTKLLRLFPLLNVMQTVDYETFNIYLCLLLL